jgi:hypothetical protein
MGCSSLRRGLGTGTCGWRARARTWSLLIQSQALCKLKYHTTENFRKKQKKKKEKKTRNRKYKNKKKIKGKN